MEFQTKIIRKIHSKIEHLELPMVDIFVQLLTLAAGTAAHSACSKWETLRYNIFRH